VKRLIAASALAVVVLFLMACGEDTGSFSRSAFYDVNKGENQQEVRAAVGTPQAVVSRSDDPARDVGEQSWLWVEGSTLYRIHFSASGEVKFTGYGPCGGREIGRHEGSLCGDV
jgi:hypothetical protein